MNKSVEKTIVAFLEDWDRHQWMMDHGEWASEEWSEEREDYSDAIEQLLLSIDKVKETVLETLDESRADSFRDVRCALEKAMEELSEAESIAKELDGQVRPDESDYIAEGTIDPDDVSDKAVDLDIGERWQGWDCYEGWSAYRVDDALYVRWYRTAYGNRHERDLWVLVDTK
jgi:hypothetical protein